MRRPLLPVLASVLGLLLAGCWAGQGAEPSDAGPPPASSAAPGPRFTSYVALGDSYTAGPLVPTTDVANGCFRSDHNYPSLLARRLDVADFTDVSCSGATTADLTRRQHTFRAGLRSPAAARRAPRHRPGDARHRRQRPRTSSRRSCRPAPGSAPPTPPAPRAPPRSAATAASTTRQIGDRVARAVRAVQRKAPDATVVLVGYLRLAPDRGTCAALPLAAGDYALGRRVNRALNDAVRSAARRTGADVPRRLRPVRGPRRLLEGPLGQRPRHRPAARRRLPPLRRRHARRGRRAGEAALGLSDPAVPRWSSSSRPAAAPSAPAG